MNNALPRSSRSTSPADYLRVFASCRQAWIVLARNLIPVVGVYLFDWSIALTTFNYWFDGVTALAAILAAAITRAMLEARRAAPITTGIFRLVAVGMAPGSSCSACVECRIGSCSIR